MRVQVDQTRQRDEAVRIHARCVRGAQPGAHLLDDPIRDEDVRAFSGAYLCATDEVLHQTPASVVDMSVPVLSA